MSKKECKDCKLYKKDKPCVSSGLCKQFNMMFFQPKEEKKER